MSWFLDEFEKGSNVGVTIGSLVTIAVAGLAAWGVRNLLSLGSLATLVVAGLAARGVSSLLSKLKSILTSKKKKREREKMISWFLGIGNNSQSVRKNGADLDEKEKNEEGSNIVVAIGFMATLVVAGLAVWGVSSLLSGLSSNVGVTFRSLATIIVAALAAWGISSLLSRLKSILISKKNKREKEKNEEGSKNKREKEKNEEGSNVGVVIGSVAALAVVGLAAWGASSLLSSTTENEDKKMKAPGKPDQRIPRANFENNTREYFCDLRQTKRNERS